MTVAPTRQGTTSTIRTSGATTLIVNKPAGMIDGDLLLAFVTDQSGSISTMYTSPGFTLGTPAMVGAQATMRVQAGYYKPIIDAASEPATYTFTNANAGGRAIVTLMVVRGADLDDPVSATTAVYGGNGTTGGSRILPITVPDNNSLFCLGVAANLSAPNASEPSSTPAGFTQNDFRTTDVSTAVSRTVLWTGYMEVDAGPTVNADTLWSPAAAAAASVMIIRPIPDAPEPPTPFIVEVWDGADLVEGEITIDGDTASVFDILGHRTQTYTVSEMMEDLQTPGEVFWAHRGGSDEFPEMTMGAYTQAIWHGVKVLECSVWMSSDGVYIMNHDQTLTRTTALTSDIPSTHSSAMLGAAVDTPDTGGVIGRLEDLLETYGQTHVIILDDKPATHKADITALVTSHYGSLAEAQEHVVFKMYGDSLLNAVSWEAAGWKTWPYLYDDMAQTINPAHAAAVSMLGLNWEASQTNWDALLAFDKPIISHLIHNAGQAVTALSKGASGFQCPKIRDVVPMVNIIP